MFSLIKKYIDNKKEIRNLKYQINSIKFDLKHALAISEKYIPLMKTSDKVQLLILRKNLFSK